VVGAGDKATTGTLVALSSDGSIARRAITISSASAAPQKAPGELTLRTEGDQLCEQFPVDFIGDDAARTIVLQGHGSLAELTISRTSSKSDCHTNDVVTTTIASSGTTTTAPAGAT
jgi:hypothetical protein